MLLPLASYHPIQQPVRVRYIYPPSMWPMHLILTRCFPPFLLLFLLLLTTWGSNGDFTSRRIWAEGSLSSSFAFRNQPCAMPSTRHAKPFVTKCLLLLAVCLFAGKVGRARIIYDALLRTITFFTRRTNDEYIYTKNTYHTSPLAPQRPPLQFVFHWINKPTACQ